MSSALAAVWLVAAAPAVAQVPMDSLRAEAAADYHGPDGTGKDGPRAKAGPVLLLVHHTYRWHMAHRRGPFQPPASLRNLPIQDSTITIDAIAREDAEALRQDLEALGLTNSAAAGRIVSGQFSLARVPDLASLETLQSVSPARAWSAPRPSRHLTPRVDPAPAGTSQTGTSRTGAHASQASAVSSRQERADSFTLGSAALVGLAVLAVVLLNE